MALPTLVKTWEHDVNNQGGISSDNAQDCQRTMFQIKDTLTGGGSGEISTFPMAVARSSDAVSHGAADYWTAYTDIKLSDGNPRAWIILRSQGTIPYEICIDMYDTSHTYQLGYVGVSMGGLFSADQGGTSQGDLSNRPTAPDARDLLGGDAPWAGGQNGAFLSRVHAMMSDDGDTMMLIVYINNVPTIIWRYDILQDPISGFVNGMHCWMVWKTSLTTAVNFSNVTSAGGKWTYDDIGERRTAYISYEAYNSTPTACSVGFIVANEWDNDWPMYPLGVWTSGTKRGRVGTISDLWLGSAGPTEADMYPSTPTLYQFAQVGDLVVPWDSTTQMLTS